MGKHLVLGFRWVRGIYDHCWLLKAWQQYSWLGIGRGTKEAGVRRRRFEAKKVDDHGALVTFKTACEFILM